MQLLFAKQCLQTAINFSDCLDLPADIAGQIRKLNYGLSLLRLGTINKNVGIMRDGRARRII